MNELFDTDTSIKPLTTRLVTVGGTGVVKNLHVWIFILIGGVAQQMPISTIETYRSIEARLAIGKLQRSAITNVRVLVVGTNFFVHVTRNTLSAIGIAANFQVLTGSIGTIGHIVSIHLLEGHTVFTVTIRFVVRQLAKYHLHNVVIALILSVGEDILGILGQGYCAIEEATV